MGVRNWSSEEEFRVVDLILEGVALDAIADALGRTTGAIEQRARRLGMLDRFNQPVRELPLTWKLSYSDQDALKSFQKFLSRFLPGEVDLGWQDPDALAVHVRKGPLRTGPGDAEVPDADDLTESVAEVDATLLFRRLKEWRLVKAKELKCPAYVVAWDSRLEAICQALPETIEALAKIPGLNRRLKGEYANELVALVRAWKLSLAPEIQEAIAQTEPEANLPPVPNEAPDRIDFDDDAEFECAPVRQVLLGVGATASFHWLAKPDNPAVLPIWKHYMAVWGRLLQGDAEPETNDERRVLEFRCALESGERVVVSNSWEKALLMLCLNIHAGNTRPGSEHRPVDGGEAFFARSQVGRLGPTARRFIKKR